MRILVKTGIGLFIILAFVINVSAQQKAFKVDRQLNCCIRQAKKTLAATSSVSLSPRNIPKGEQNWKYSSIHDWTSGFWPGILWYLYQYTHYQQWKASADSFTRALTPDAYNPHFDHDLGFMLYKSFAGILIVRFCCILPASKARKGSCLLLRLKKWKKAKIFILNYKC